MELPVNPLKRRLQCQCLDDVTRGPNQDRLPRVPTRQPDGLGEAWSRSAPRATAQATPEIDDVFAALVFLLVSQAASYCLFVTSEGIYRGGPAERRGGEGPITRRRASSPTAPPRGLYIPCS